MELGLKIDDLGGVIENDESSDRVVRTELADERMVNPNSTSNINKVDN